MGVRLFTSNLLILDQRTQRVMQIFVRTLDDRTLTLNVQPEDTIDDIKEIIEQREGNVEQNFLNSINDLVCDD